MRSRFWKGGADRLSVPRLGREGYSAGVWRLGSSRCSEAEIAEQDTGTVDGKKKVQDGYLRLWRGRVGEKQTDPTKFQTNFGAPFVPLQDVRRRWTSDHVRAGHVL